MTDLAAGVAAALAATGDVFGPGPDAPAEPGRGALPAPRWGALYAALSGGDEEFAVDVELIYEGYLLHYRESRTPALAAGDLETRLLAGDCFYARGLRGIAARGDADAVSLLARLMAVCAYLRDAGAPFAADDALWAYTMGGLAAQHEGAAPAAVAALFDDVEAGFWTWAPGPAAGRPASGSPVNPPLVDQAADLRAAVAVAAGRLALRDPAPLLRELDAAGVLVTAPAASRPAASRPAAPRPATSDCRR